MELKTYLRPRSRLKWILSLATLAMAAPAFWLFTLAYTDYQTVEQLREHNTRLMAKTAKPSAPKVGRNEKELTKHWNDLKTELDFPWLRLFAAVERADSDQIELLDFQPDKLNRVVTLRGKAINTQALISYLDVLADQPLISQAYLVHQQAAVQDKLDIVDFEIKVTLR